MTKENIWSNDGIALKPLEKENDSFEYLDDINVAQYGLWNDGEGMNCSLKAGNVFKTKQRAELEKDRREVDYIMKKMACESREDNDWRYHPHFGDYYLIYDEDYVDTSEENYDQIGFRATHYYVNKNIIFNQAHFFTEEDVQTCVDYLLKTYKEPRLKEIWGIN